MTKIDTSDKTRMVVDLASHLGVDLSTVMSWYGGKTFQGTTIDKLEFFREVVTGSLSEQSEAMLNERCDLEFLKDRRTPVEYGVELAYGWIVEDIILVGLLYLGIEADLDSIDKEREYLDKNNISSRSDYKVKLHATDEEKMLELVVSWTDYWRSSDCLDLRQTKYNSMMSKAEGTICLGVEIPTLTGFCFDMQEVGPEFEKRDNPAWGFKPAYTLYGLTGRMVSLSDAMNFVE